MSINILHISDLHFCTKSNQDSIRYNYDNDDFETLFIKKFISYNVNYLIISGDISNESKPMEYDTASKFLNNCLVSINPNSSLFKLKLFNLSVVVFSLRDKFINYSSHINNIIICHIFKYWN